MVSEQSHYALDTSVIVAILTREPGWESWEERLTTAVWLGVGVPTLLETYIVMARKFKVDPRPRIDTMIQARRIEILPVLSNLAA